MITDEDTLLGQGIQTTILIPAYNEEEALPHVLKSVFEVIDDTFEVIVVDDGSRDNTRAVASAFPCRVISHEMNRGKGAAIQTGLLFAQGQRIIFIDADGTYPPEVFPQIVASLKEYDLVRCIRSNGRDHIPLVNRIGNNLFDKIISSIHGMDGTDFMTGLYGAKKSHLLAMNLNSNGFDIETEIAIKAKVMNLKSTNIPIEYYQRLGEKKLRPVRDGTKILIRMFLLALTYNPVLTFIVPGLILWIGATIGLVLLSLSPVAANHPNSFIVGAMGFLAGFQLIAFGYEAILYIARSGMGRANPKLVRLVEKFPLGLTIFLSLASILIGGVWSLNLVTRWILSGFDRFLNTQSLIFALVLVVLGIQMLSTLLFLSLFAHQDNRPQAQTKMNQSFKM